MNEQTLVNMILGVANDILTLSESYINDAGDFSCSALIRDGRRDGLLLAHSAIHALLATYYEEKLKDLKR